ncbi:MAG: LamG-like jellyroll fold domain-containing protein, partial [Blastocatellia bacterium]
MKFYQSIAFLKTHRATFSRRCGLALLLAVMILSFAGWRAGASQEIANGNWLVRLKSWSGLDAATPSKPNTSALKADVFNPTSAVAVSGAALNFDGTNDYVNLGTGLSSAFNGTNKITIQAWVYPTAFGGLKSVISNLNISGGTPTYWMRMNDEGKMQFSLETTSGGVTVTTGAALSLNAWKHITATWDGSTIRIYVNGIPDGSQAQSGSFPASSNTVTLGISYFDTPQEQWQGTLDEVRVWNNALNQAEIQANYNRQLAGTESGLLAYYKFNQGMASADNSGVTTLTDSSPNGRNGTLSGFALTGTTSNWIEPGGPLTTTPTISLTPTVSHEVLGDGTLDPATPGQVFAFNAGFPDSTNEHRGVVVYQLPTQPAGTELTNVVFDVNSVSNPRGGAIWDVELHALGVRASSSVSAGDFSASSTLIQANYLDHLTPTGSSSRVDLSSAGRANLIAYLRSNYAAGSFLFLRLQPPNGTTPVMGQHYHTPMPGHFNATRHPLMSITFDVVSTPPTISCPQNQTAYTNVGASTAVVNYPAPTATGLPTPTVTCNPASGSTFNLGVTTVNCTATNGTAPNATCNFTVTVNKVGGTATDPLLCTGTGNTVQATLVITNNGNVNQTVSDTTTFTNLVGVPNTCTVSPNVGTCTVTN